MFEIAIQAGQFESALKPLSMLSEDCIVEVYDDRLRIPSTNKSRAASGVAELQKDDFDSYRVSEQEFGLDLEELNKVFQTVNDDTTLRLELDETKRAIYVTADNQKYRIGLISLEAIRRGPDSYDLEYDSYIKIPFKEWDQAISTADLFADKIGFKSSEDSLELLIEGAGDTNLTRRNISPKDSIDFDLDVFDNEYESRFLVNLNKCIPKESDIEVWIKDGRPIKIHYQIDDGTINITYRIAPKIKND